MKVVLVFGLLLSLVVGLMSHAGRAKEDEASVSREENVRGLELSIIAQKRRYKPTDQIKFDVMVTNLGKEAI